MTSKREDRIRRRAYELWEADGRPEGRHSEHWERAAREIEAEEKEPGENPGLSSGSQAGGTKPGASPATGAGSIGAGGGSTADRKTGTAKRARSGGGAKPAGTGKTTGTSRTGGKKKGE